VKTEAGIRLIPVHPELAKLGFWDYLESRKGKVRLFDDFGFGKFWNETFLKSVGLKRPELTFHSFRHTYNRALRKFQSDETKNRLMGHAPASIGEAYGGGVDENEMRAFCEHFAVPADLSHLYPIAKP
jgi:integrase